MVAVTRANCADMALTRLGRSAGLERRGPRYLRLIAENYQADRSRIETSRQRCLMDRATRWKGSSAFLMLQASLIQRTPAGRCWRRRPGRIWGCPAQAAGGFVWLMAGCLGEKV